jgi:hypothetical protein
MKNSLKKCTEDKPWISKKLWITLKKNQPQMTPKAIEI